MRVKDHPLYNRWKKMVHRCHNSYHHKYHLYGARGIVVCDRWRSFDNFVLDMGMPPSDAHTVERVDNDGPYSPSNCVWATPKQQQRNRRNTIHLTVGDRTMPLTEWCEMLDVSPSACKQRLAKGWGPMAVLYGPISSSKYKKSKAIRDIIACYV